MIEATDQSLKEWIGTVVQGADVRLTPPVDSGDSRVVSLYLMDLLPAPRASTSRRLPLQISLRYLVTAWDENPEDAHRVLGDLVFAAMEHPGFEVELGTLSTEAWAAFGVAPRPAFMLRLPLQIERPEPQVPHVHRPVEVRIAPAVSLSGLLVGPGDIPLGDVRVELPTLQLSTHTDAQGRFRFGAVPAEPSTKELRVRIKGSDRLVKVEHNRDAREPMVIRFETMEV